MNDASNLYILLTLSDNELDAGDSALVAFDNNHDGNARGLGDDALEVTGAGAFFDEFYTGASPPVAVLDTTDGGMNDGAGAAGALGGFNVFEIQHPLNSVDNSHDFSLVPGIPVGFAVRYLDAADGKFAWWPSYHSSVWFEIAVAFPPGQPDFSVALNPATVTVTRNGTASTTLDLASISNFAGQITLTTGSAPAFLSLTYSQNPVMLAGGGNASAGISVSTAENAVLSVYPIKITATGGGISHNVYLTVTIVQPGPDFRLTLSPSEVALPTGGEATTQLAVQSIEGFSSAVTISLDWAGAEPSGVTVDAIPPLTPPAGQTATAIVTVRANSDATLGDFTLTFIAISGTLSHGANLTINVTIPPGDFSILVAPEKNVVVGAQATMAVIVQSLGGFTLPVTLSATGIPGGVTVSFNPNPVTPPGGGAVESTMLVSASQDATRGTFTILVIGSDGTRTRNATLILRVSACLIATATYGSELSPEVNTLRDFRDTVVLRSYLGSNFMQVFDAWYYSFSPQVAREIDSSNAAKQVFKIGLYPTIMSLAAAKNAAYPFGAWEELATFTAGILAAAFLGTSYLAAPLFAGSLLSRRILRGIRFCSRYGILSMIPAVAASLLGLAFQLDAAAQIGTVLSVLVVLLCCPCGAVLLLEKARVRVFRRL
jgi:hypothetical protein